MRLRQAVIVARELEPVVEQLCDRLGLSVCFRDPGVAEFGIHNALMPVGDTFIEVISPLRDGTAAGRSLDRWGGDAGYMLLIQVDDLDAERARVEALGVRSVWQGTGPGIRGMHLHPADVGAAIVSLDEADPPGSWGWAGGSWHEHVRTGVVRDIAGVEVRSEDPQARARRWSTVLGRPLGRDPGDGAARIDLEGVAVRFAPASDGRGERIAAIDLVATDPARAGEAMTIGGVEVRLVGAAVMAAGRVIEEGRVG